jgi:hypothetical protein
MDNPNETVMTTALLQQWYPQGLYVIAEEGSPKPAAKAVPRRHLILSSEEVSAPLMELLAGIIQACRIDMADVNIVHLKEPAHYGALLGAYGPVYVILFGVEPARIDLPIVFPHFQAQKFSDASWVSSPELGLIQNDRQMKVKLWNCLKQVYGI